MSQNDQFRSVLKASEGMPEHMLSRFKTKCLDDLRLCTNAPIPAGYHGPELPPHMLPEGVEPSPIKTVTPVVNLITPDNADSGDCGEFHDAINQGAYQTVSAQITSGARATEVVMDTGYTQDVLVPKQSVAMLCQDTHVDFSTGNVRIRSDIPFNSMNLIYSDPYKARGTKIVHMAVKPLEHDYNILDMCDVNTSTLRLAEYHCIPYQFIEQPRVIRTYDEATQTTTKTVTHSCRKKMRPWYDAHGSVRQFALPFKDLRGSTKVGCVTYKGDIVLNFDNT